MTKTVAQTAAEIGHSEICMWYAIECAEQNGAANFDTALEWAAEYVTEGISDCQCE